jgi:Obg family GTPase CgtA-like protein
MGAYRIEREASGIIRVRGKRLEQFTQMTNFDATGGVQRFRDVLDRVGFMKALKQFRRDDEEEAQVYIGDIRVDEQL